MYEKLFPDIFKERYLVREYLLSLQDRSKNRRGQSLIDAHIWKFLIYLEWKLKLDACSVIDNNSRITNSVPKRFFVGAASQLR